MQVLQVSGWNVHETFSYIKETHTVDRLEKTSRYLEENAEVLSDKTLVIGSHGADSVSGKLKGL